MLTQDWAHDKPASHPCGLYRTGSERVRVLEPFTGSTSPCPNSNRIPSRGWALVSSYLDKSWLRWNVVGSSLCRRA